MSKRNEFLIAGVSEKRAKARRQSKAGTPMDMYLKALPGIAKRNRTVKSRKFAVFS
jgi:hypothetical protein